MSLIQIILVGIVLATAGVEAASPGEACTGNGGQGNCDYIFALDYLPGCVADGSYAAHESSGLCSTPVGEGYDCSYENSVCIAQPDEAEQECRRPDDNLNGSKVCLEKVVEPATCPEGWIRVSSCDDTEAVCVQMQRPIKFISWFHMAYECDVIGGFLPEPSTTGLNQQFNLLLKGYEQLYGKTMLFLGASDLSHTGEWKWQNGKNAISELDWDKESTSAENLDCMAKVSTTSEKYTAINCEADSMETQVAFMCMRKMK